MRNLTLLLTAALCLAAACPARAGWFNDPYNGFVTVAGTPASEYEPRACALAGGRTMIAWMRDFGGYGMIHYQVLDQFGNALLPTNGTQIVDGNWYTGWGGPAINSILPDRQGGCITVFEDNRDGTWDIWGQRVDSLGNRLWGATGMPIVIWPGPATEDAGPKDFNCDSLGNYFLSWVMVGVGDGLYIQKFRADGIRLWGDYGAVVNIGLPNVQEFQQSVPDMAGGIIDVWEDYRFGGEFPPFYVQHLNAAGHPLLAQNGIWVPLPENGFLFEGISDGAGGGVWTSRNPLALWVWRLNGAGHIQWIWNSSPYGNNGVFNMLRHPSDGTIWLATGNSSGNFIYRFNLNGHSLFGNNGVPYGGYLVPVSNGVISTIRQTSPLPLCIHAERIDSMGNLKWSSAVAINDSFYGPASTTNGADGAVIAFGDERHWSTNQDDLLAQRVNNNGSLGTPTKYHPQPLPGITNLSPGQISYVLGQAGHIDLDLYDVLGRHVASLESGYKQAGTYRYSLGNRNLTSGIYLIKLTSPAGVQAAKVLVIR